MKYDVIIECGVHNIIWAYTRHNYELRCENLLFMTVTLTRDGSVVRFILGGIVVCDVYKSSA